MPVTSSDTTEGKISVDGTNNYTTTDNISFLASNWYQDKTVKVQGQNDYTLDGNQSFTVQLGSLVSDDANYHGIDPLDMPLTNVEDVFGAIVVNTNRGETSEDGEKASFSVRLGSEPEDNVFVLVTSQNTSEGTVETSDNLTFGTTNWNGWQTITIKGVDDNLTDGNIAYQVKVAADNNSADSNYNDNVSTMLSLKNYDNEAAGFRVSDISGKTTESGGQAFFSVRLTARPIDNVTITVTSDNQSEGTVAISGLTFTSSDWSSEQLVTVTGIDDTSNDNDTSYQIVLGADTSTDDTNYRNLDPPNVLVVNQDNEIPGYTVSLPSGSTTETGGTAFFTVVLNSVPSNTVQLELSSSDTDEGQITAISGSGGSINSTGTSTLNFSNSNWNSVRTVTVKGQNDSSVDGHQAYTVNLAINDSNTLDNTFDDLDNQTVLLTNVDDETAGFVISELSGTVSETGTSAVFSVRLTSEPITTVTVAAVSDNTTEASVSPSSWQFTTTNWSGEKQFMVTGVDDNLTDGNKAFSIDLRVDNSSSSDTMYEALNPSDVLGTNIDDDTAGFSVGSVSGPSSETGGIALFTVKLNMAPTNNVTVYATSADTSEGKILQDNSDNQTTDNLSVVFTSSDWSSEHKVRVKGQDDSVTDGHQGFLVQLSSAVSNDSRYHGLDPNDVVITNYDDETAGFLISAPSGSTSESGDNSTFTVRLTSSPSASSSVVLDVDSSDDTEGLIDNSTAQKLVTFTTSDWSSAQTITVTGQNDFNRDGNQPYTINITLSSSSDSNYSGLNPQDVQLTNLDNEFAGVRVSAPSASITSEGGTNVTFTVTLNTIPIYDVTIPVYVSDSSEALVSVSGGSAADNITLTFNAGTSSAVTVTVTGQNDNLSDSDQPYWVILSEASSQDGDYQGINPQDVALTNTDDESGIPGFIITPPDNATTTESGQDRTFTIKLSAKPISDVTIPVYVSDSSEALLTGNVDNLTLTFTSSNFDTAQTITAIAQNDTVDDGDVSYTVFLMPAKSSDSRYNGLNPQDLGFVNVDDDTSSTYGFIITAPTSSASVSESNTGTASTFNVSLTTAPSQNVTINAYVSDDTEAEIETSASSGKANNKTLTFSAGSTSSITVSVFAKDESDNDSDQFFQVILLPASSSDNNYNGLDPQDLGFVNQDND